MKIPNAEIALLDLAKLRTYSLNPHHSRGGNKARVFRDALGIDGSHAEWLRAQILRALRDAEANVAILDNYGTRYSADITITRQNRRAVIRTEWIIRHNEDFPQFISTWVK